MCVLLLQHRADTANSLERLLFDKLRAARDIIRSKDLILEQNRAELKGLRQKNNQLEQRVRSLQHDNGTAGIHNRSEMKLKLTYDMEHHFLNPSLLAEKLLRYDDLEELELEMWNYGAPATFLARIADALVGLKKLRSLTISQLNGSNEAEEIEFLIVIGANVPPNLELVDFRDSLQLISKNAWDVFKERMPAECICLWNKK